MMRPRAAAAFLAVCALTAGSLPFFKVNFRDIAKEANLSTVNVYGGNSRKDYILETTGNGVCTHFTQITKAAGDTKPKIVSQSSGDCGTDTTQAGESQPTQGAKTINLRTTTRPAVTQSM